MLHKLFTQIHFATLCTGTTITLYVEKQVTGTISDCIL